jgi:diguanylate cyclase (GGDEF)-like protein
VFNGSQWVGLTTDDGLVWDDTDSDSFHESPDGSVWIGTTGGLSHIRHPEEIFHREPLAVRIFDARLGGEPILSNALVKAPTRIPWSRRGALTMDLGVSNPGRGSLVHYRYRLEGSDSEWQETDEPLVRYAGLPPGKYKLVVMAIDGRRHQESAPVSIEFRLMPPWWRTAWFLCCLAVTIAALVGLASWLRVSALIAQQQKLEELVRERTCQLEMEKRELIEARMALVEQASRDGLTGLLNRSAIFDVLSNEIQYASEKNTSLAIVLADLDHFKRINDTYGHQIGDAVLRECARRFRQATRPTDYVGRYGGEELLLILPGLSQDNSMERLENLRATIAHELFDCEGIGLPVTCSFGVAWLDEHSRGIKPLIALADQALYVAKTRGRNRVETITSASSGLFFPDGSGPLVTV